MGKLFRFNELRVMAGVISTLPSQIVLFDVSTGGIRWHSPAAERALQGLSGGQAMHLHDVMLPEEAEAWILEGKLVLKSQHPMEYVEHASYVGDKLVSSRSGIWPSLELPSRQLTYVRVVPASIKRQLAVRLSLPLDGILKLAETYLESTKQQESPTLTG